MYLIINFYKIQEKSTITTGLVTEKTHRVKYPYTFNQTIFLRYKMFLLNFEAKVLCMFKMDCSKYLVANRFHTSQDI